jgi:predicted lipoprotein with Yx(FWY)xxD motif
VAIADTSAGSILVDDGGRTLYMFTADIDGASTCYGGCETTWPPAPSGLASGEDITATLGETTRDDGSMQLTVNGRPVYTYSGDQVPGDVTGQGVGGAWFVIGPDGEPITG